MSRLTVWDAATKEEILRTEDAHEISAALGSVGVRFERWPVAPLPKGAPAEAVLALGDDLDVPVSVGHGLLDPLIENPRIHTGSLFRPGDDNRWFGHDLSFI